MGDRGNFCVRSCGQDFGVYLYGHWMGADMPRILVSALRRSEARWYDAPYFARALFCEMLRHDSLDGLRWYGISTGICDNEHPVIVLDCERGVVSIIKVGDGADIPPVEFAGVPFAKVAELENPSWTTLTRVCKVQTLL